MNELKGIRSNPVHPINLLKSRFRRTFEKTRFMKYAELTQKIIGCAFKVHSTLGNGFQEVIYQRALAIELTKTGILYIREFEMPIYYDNEIIGTRRVDFLIEEKISVELKAQISLEKVHLAQAINYLEAYHLETGLLLNFGAVSLEVKRLLNRKHPLFRQGQIPGS